MNPQINALLREALMCSLFVDPTSPGITVPELFEIGRQAGFQDGEIGDTIPHLSKEEGNGFRYLPSHHDVIFGELLEAADPPLFDTVAADFVKTELNVRIRADGIRNARLDRGVIVERAITAGHNRVAVEGAITCLVAGEVLALAGESLTPRQMHGPLSLFAEKQRPRSARTNPAVRTRALALVRDIVGRRTDGRPRHAEPLDAFADALERIGFRQFRAWWRQTVSELRGSDPGAAPIACTVLSAALVEGALTFAARYARDRQLGAFQSSDFDGDPRTWKAEKLIESATRGGPAAILTAQLRVRAEHLNRMRQRVHVGRLLGENPGGVPDLQPEEGRDAKSTAEQVIRAVLDWLERSQSA
ncbi:hypothetical protein [Methylobacterium goesingense]|uniref:Uncharacterized protein n=1 Tax=Methylobacterium goesingense TaxID=243690 RepID=A0ABV2LDF5_9HYPH|nr:hypothetical protein [Methylobacterium goesingense]GJD73603.1 hypothetical protein CFIICLFH_1832 [Methylobacterium goesingense]